MTRVWSLAQMVGVVLLAGSLLLVACGDDDSNDTAQEEASPTRTREGDQGVAGS